jgi:hypothetical protein
VTEDLDENPSVASLSFDLTCIIVHSLFDTTCAMDPTEVAAHEMQGGSWIPTGWLDAFRRRHSSHVPEELSLTFSFFLYSTM